MKAVFIALYVGLTSFLGASTNNVYQVWQALSLSGTDVQGVEGHESGVANAVVMSRPVVLSGAIPEDLVYAVMLPHKMISIGRYAQQEANLAMLTGIQTQVDFDGEALKIVIDVSKIHRGEGVGIALEDVITLTCQAIEKTLQQYAKANLGADVECSFIVQDKQQKRQQFERLSYKLTLRGVEGKAEE